MQASQKSPEHDHEKKGVIYTGHLIKAFFKHSQVPTAEASDGCKGMANL
jgi:hypothetical protein